MSGERGRPVPNKASASAPTDWLLRGARRSRSPRAKAAGSAKIGAGLGIGFEVLAEERCLGGVRVNQVVFQKSVTQLEDCPPEVLPEFSFIGRSNVGKSTLINLLTRQKSLARVSKTPGRTQEINFFLVDKKWRLVDLPGYGYAKVPKTLQERFNEFVSDYLINREGLRGVFVLIDSRLPPQKLDLAFVKWLVEYEVRFALVFTKADKVKASGLAKAQKAFLKEMEAFCEGAPPIFESSLKDPKSQKAILGFIGQAIEA